jgi:uncharacterized membrane protein YfcA
MVETAVLIGVTLVAAFVMSTLGFGFGLIAMPIYTWFVGVKVANPVMTLLMLVLEIVVIWPIRRHINLKPLLPLFAGVVVGMPFGIWGLIELDESILRLAVGVIVVVYLSYDVFFPRARTKRLPLPVGVLLGVATGAVTGAISLPGPLVLIYMSSLQMEKYELKASVILMFIGFTVYKIPLLAIGGLLTGRVFRLAGILAVPLLVGILIGMYVFERISSRVFTNLLRILLGLSAVLLIGRTILRF